MDFLRQDSVQTLSEALQEYYASREDLVSGRGLSAPAREFFRCHDTVHVVFGCGTTLPSEACVKMWSFFGTDAGLGNLIRGYNLPESNEIYDKLTFNQILEAAGASAWIVPTVFIKSRNLNKKWPWSEFDAYAQCSLTDIRSEFGIDVVTIPNRAGE